MEKGAVKAYGYRWVILVAFMLIGGLNQALWITFAPITSDAMKFYATSDIAIGFIFYDQIPSSFWIFTNKLNETFNRSSIESINLIDIICAVPRTFTNNNFCSIRMYETDDQISNITMGNNDSKT